MLKNGRGLVKKVENVIKLKGLINVPAKPFLTFLTFITFTTSTTQQNTNNQHHLPVFFINSPR
jgi:hypothetical protein